MGPKKGGVSGKARTALTIKTKKEIIELHNKGAKVVDLALKFKVNKSTIGTILKKKDEIAQAKVAKGMTRLYNDAVRMSLIDEVERLLMVWINERQMKA